MIGHETDQRKHEEGVRKAEKSTRKWTLERVEQLRKEEQESTNPILRARVGDLAIGRCWPYLDM